MPVNQTAHPISNGLTEDRAENIKLQCIDYAIRVFERAGENRDVITIAKEYYEWITQTDINA